MKEKSIVLVIIILVAASFFQTAHARAAADDGWSFLIEPYILGANIEGDAGVGRVTGAEVDVDFGDILENLQMAAMIHMEAQHSDGWGFIIDYGMMDLGADFSGTRGGIIDVGVRQQIVEILASKRINLADGYYELISGFRWWQNDLDLTVDPAVHPGSASASLDEDWLDPIIGVRYLRPLSEKWDLVLRADVGGFGVASDFTSQAAGGVHYRFTGTTSLDVQYKAVWVDYETGNKGTPGYFAYDTVTHGPVLGVIFRF